MSRASIVESFTLFMSAEATWFQVGVYRAFDFGVLESTEGIEVGVQGVRFTRGFGVGFMDWSLGFGVCV